MAEFSQSQVETGRVTFNAGDAAEVNDTLQVTFKSKFNFVPNVSITFENSNKTAIAHNVNTSGFELILSDSGFDVTLERVESTFVVHYTAVSVF